MFGKVALTSGNTSMINTLTGGFMFCLWLPFMPLTKNLEKNSCKNPNLLPLLEPQCFTAAVVFPSPFGSLQEEWGGWRVTSSEMCLANMGFLSQTIPHPCLKWLHLNITVVLKSLLFGGGGDTGKALCW